MSMDMVEIILNIDVQTLDSTLWKLFIAKCVQQAPKRRRNNFVFSFVIFKQTLTALFVHHETNATKKFGNRLRVSELKIGYRI